MLPVKKCLYRLLITATLLGFSGWAYAQPHVTTEQWVSYRSDSEQEIPAIVVAPKTRGAYPGVVYVHGRWGLSEPIIAHLHRIAERGFIVFAPDYHFARAVPALANFNDLNSTRDIESGVRFFKSMLKNKSVNSPARIALIGQDHGGYHAVLIAVKMPIEISALIGVYPLIQSPNENKINQLYSYMPDVENVKAPSLFLIGKADREMRRIQIGRAVRRMNELKHPVTHIEYMGAGRCFDWRINNVSLSDQLARQDIINQIAQFVKTHTGGSGQLILSEHGWKRI